MGTLSRQLAIGVLGALEFAGVGGTAFATQADPPAIALAALDTAQGLHGSRVRTNSQILGTVIREAAERSRTFSALVAAIDATDGLVYL
ncbi:MAG: hypothetical protein HYY76_10260 [Acidobacteria bacterium]|nr:hypothetical protein [Acidobacteriota bacterium]